MSCGGHVTVGIMLVAVQDRYIMGCAGELTRPAQRQAVGEKGLKWGRGQGWRGPGKELRFPHLTT